jgi:putative colanic acid biosynthesis acetyltransferase WcaF
VKDSERMYQDLKSFSLPKYFRGRNPIFVQLWWIIQAVLVSTSPQFMYGWRRFLFRSFGAKIGENVLLRPSVKMTFPWHIEIGDNTWIGDNVVLYSLDRIKIGCDVVVSQNSYICSGTHDFSKITFDMVRKPVVIEDQAWLANDVYVAPGVTVGRGAVVGTRSSVFDDLPRAMICYGSPAKPIKYRVAE